MLAMDKAYLSKEVALLQDKAAGLAAALEERGAKVEALRADKRAALARVAELEAAAQAQVGGCFCLCGRCFHRNCSRKLYMAC